MLGHTFYAVLHCTDIQLCSKLFIPMLNMIKEGCENKSISLFILMFYFLHLQKSNLALENKDLKWEGNLIIK